MLKLYDGARDFRSYAKTTLSEDADLAKLFGHALGDGAQWTLDFDPMWREVILFAADTEAQTHLARLLEALELEGRLSQHGALLREVPTQAAQGQAKRAYRRDGKMHKIEVTASVQPGEAGSGLQVEAQAGVAAPVLEHGVWRAARVGPVASYPAVDAQVKVAFTARPEGSVPALADLHAAATYAASRAFAAAQMEARELLSAAVVDPTPFPDMENSASETLGNLRGIFAYPFEELGEDDRSQLGAFVAYQVSNLLGHELDERMRRTPKVPSEPLRPLLSHLVSLLAEEALSDGRVGAQMVVELLDIWVRDWREPLLPKAEPAQEASPAEAEMAE